MANLVSLTEAASYLGVSKATLRNWDKEGKLKARRHPLNRYRVYDLDDLRALRRQALPLGGTNAPEAKASQNFEIANQRSVKRIVSRLHGILRDTDGDSSIIQRFDELTKLLFLKVAAERDEASLFTRRSGDSVTTYVARVRAEYARQCKRYSNIIPARFAALNCSDAAIDQCGAVLSTLSFASTNFDVKGIAYEEVIRGTFDKSDHQQFFTPHQIVDFMVSMVRPFLGGIVADPACGTAGFLTEIVRSGAPFDKLLGFEIDERLAWVSGINLLLHGASGYEVRCLANGGSLGRRINKHFGKLDAILTNPPFGSDLTDLAALESFELGKGRASRRRGILFVERCWSLLKNGGILGIIIDDGVLNLPSTADVRRFILDHFDVLAIVSLPESAFMPYATVNASVLVLRKSSARKKSRRVFFAKSENIGRKLNGDDDILYDVAGGARPNSDLPEILACWQRMLAGHLPEDDGLTFIANVAENLAGDENGRLDFRYHHPSRNRSRDLLAKSGHELVSLADLCVERNETVIPSTEMPDQLILYTGLANIEAGNGVAHQVPTPAASLKSAVKRYDPIDIVFARMRPNLRKVALMSFAEGGYVSPECSVLTVRKGADGRHIVDPEILAVVLRSDLVFGQILHLIAGIGRPRLNTSDLRKVRIPVPPFAAQLESRAEFIGRLASARQLRAKAQALLTEAAALEAVAVDRLASQMISG